MYTKSRICLVISSILFLSSFCNQNVGGESFVLPKKKKSSTKKTKEKICNNFVDQISCSPSLRKKIAQIDQMLQQETRKYLENDSDGVIKSAKKQNVSEILDHSEDFSKKMEDFCNECDNYLQYIESQV